MIILNLLQKERFTLHSCRSEAEEQKKFLLRDNSVAPIGLGLGSLGNVFLAGPVQ